MRLEDVITYLQEPQTLEALRNGWEESLAALPQPAPPFLSTAEITSSREWAGLPQSLDPQLDAMRARITGDPVLLALAWHTWTRLSGLEEGAQLDSWPTLEHVLGDSGGTFYLIIALAIVPHMRAVHAQMGIPESVTRDTCRVLWCLNYNHGRINGGRPGVLRKELYWLRYHLTGKLFRLGRMEYMLRPFAGRLKAYRNVTTRRVVALAADGTRFDAQGYLPQTGDAVAEEPDGGWTASLVNKQHQVSGYVISPYGRALHHRLTLALNQWQLVLEPNQTVIEMHIPEGSDMSPERCHDSLQRAFRFFSIYFPQRPAHAVQCHSWIFGPQLEQILPASANLVQLMREVYLFPVRHAPNEGLYYVFGDDNVDLAAAAQNTSLQRGVVSFLSAGGTWRCGGMFLLQEELHRFGRQPYRSNWPASLGGGPSSGG